MKNNENKPYWSDALSWPFYFLILYFSVDYLRPHDLYPLFESARVPLLTSIIILIIWTFKGNKRALKEPLIQLYFLFLLIMGIGFFSAVNTYWVFKETQHLLIYLFVGVLPITSFLAKPVKIRLFFRVWIVIHILLAIYGITHKGRGPGAMLADENDLALALNMCIPYAFFLYQSPSTKFKEKVFYIIAIILLVSAVIATQSRGGFLGLMAAAFGIVFFSKNWIRNLWLIALSIPILFFLFSPRYLQEIESIQDTANATRQDRLYSWRRGWEMFMDHPILGVGAGNYPWNVEKYELQSSEYDPRMRRLHGGRVAHSLYFTLIPELGISGVLIYSAILISLFRKLKKISSRSHFIKPKTDEQIELILLSHAMAASLFSYLICGAFISVLYYQHFWYLIGFAIALDYAVENSVLDQGESSKKVRDAFSIR